MNHLFRKVARLGIMFFLVLLTLAVIAPGPGPVGAMDQEHRLLLAGLFGSSSKTPAPDFELKDLNGSTVKLSQFKGDRPVMLYFWATWCPACISMKPQLVKVRERVPEKEMEILGINVGEGDSLEKVKRYQQGHPAPWPTLYDNGSNVARNYRVQGIPLFVLIDKEGMIVYRGNDLPQDPLKLLK